MAKRLPDGMPGTAVRRSRYPWDEWADGSAWEIIQGEDFTAGPESMRSYLYAQAARRGQRVEVRVEGTVLWFQFYAPNGNGAS